MATILVQEDGSGDAYTTLTAAVSNAGAADTIEISETWSAPEETNITISDAGLIIQAVGASKVTTAGHYSGSPTHYRIEDNSGGHVFTTSAACTITGLDIKQTGSGGSDECVRWGAATTLNECILSCARGAVDQDGCYAGGAYLLTLFCKIY